LMVRQIAEFAIDEIEQKRNLWNKYPDR
jgi:hypothetical protein